ncbi:ABC transporter substrate-binding protein [Limnohabitans sp. Jir72]|uniref:ABC transporter substrate-binding protein n=1 Tax=Limnohabitans sp. Jir72 TaxID=1977909 RepID=UPI000D3BC722|nr:ABC transporter substrate-binding protein [Limnohabitans sp. Jir72]PUE35850.1 nitrate ABC transporter substrate-binding protein [Limnohabitans sp. Jir72]
MNRRIAHWALAWGLLGGALAQAQDIKTEAPAVIRIGVATVGVGNPIRHGGTSTALAYADKAIEDEFRKDGTKVEWIFFKGAGPAVNEALVNKQLDLAWQGDLPSIVHRAAGVKTKIILGSGVRNGLYLGVAPESNIRRIEDLRGKKVAVFKGTNLHLAAVRALADHGLKEKDVKLINLDPAASAAALVSKDIDASFDYVGLFNLRDKGLAKIIWSAHEDNFKYTRQTALLVTDEFAAKHPKAVERVVKVIVKYAHKYSDENRRAELFDAWGKAEYPDKIWREDFIGQPLRVRLSPLLDPFLVARYKDAANESFDLKLTRGKPEIDSWFDRSYLNAALKELKLENYWPAYAANGQQVGR